jgi:multisubunit Na+/H+ antiporter MnhB subunit
MTRRKPVQEHSWDRIISATFLAILLIVGCTLTFPGVNPPGTDFSGALFLLGIVWLITAVLAMNTHCPGWLLGLIGLIAAGFVGLGLTVTFHDARDLEEGFARRFAIGWCLVTLLQWALCRATVWLRPEVHQKGLMEEVKRESN